MRYAYQYNGRPLLSWKRAPPQQTRAADAKSLGAYEDFPGGQLINIDGQKAAQAMGCACSTVGMGSLAGSSLDGPTLEMPLPRPGAPEPLPTLGAIDLASIPTPVKLAAAAGIAYLIFKRKKRR